MGWIDQLQLQSFRPALGAVSSRKANDPGDKKGRSLTSFDPKSERHCQTAAYVLPSSTRKFAATFLILAGTSGTLCWDGARLCGDGEPRPISLGGVMGDIVIRNEDGNSRRIGREGVSIIERMAREGMALATIAKRLRMSRTTLNEIRKRQPEVEEAIERGYSGMEDELVDLLMLRARNLEHPGGTTAAIFLLKSRRGYEGTKTPQHLTVINNDHRTISFPSAKDMDEYRRRIAADA
ncbi:hypothetical protein [Altererythrobacter lutimaris]|uniref:Helix-turn-helix domain-containing protein n=1 Tax=Altererythrobacter lutimaris TaxID=2743979 RepID=A0A850HIZ2_9SPHN|nr:hypothetical protein [Altererythrobacter lutimaris]NVE95892.1 hypothetical protein [Altererythrobacter lutimaris]